MSIDYAELSAKEADDYMRGQIGCIVFEALDEARRMKPEELQERDIFEWSHYVSGLIAVIIQNRLRAGPCPAAVRERLSVVENRT